MRKFIATVGTSLLTNRDDDLAPARRRPWAGWARGRPLPTVESVDGWLRSAPSEAASAEVNTVERLEPGPQDRLVLLHSATPEGRFCAERLQAFWSAKLREARAREIGNLGYEAAGFEQRGLRSLVSIVFGELHVTKGVVPVLCATGGFKAEIAFLNLIGALQGVEVVYIHEQFRRLVRLPRLPLSWDEKAVLRHKAFFKWVEEEPRRAEEVERRLRAAEELRPLVDEAEDGCAYLNAAGHLLFEAAQARAAEGPRAVWPKADPRPPDEKLGLSGVAHHRPPGWEQFVRRLASIDCVTRVRFDPEAAGSAGRVRVLQSGRGVIGVLFAGELPLRVETTARGEAQCELVASYLRDRVVR